MLGSSAKCDEQRAGMDADAAERPMYEADAYRRERGIAHRALVRNRLLQMF